MFDRKASTSILSVVMGGMLSWLVDAGIKMKRRRAKKARHQRCGTDDFLRRKGKCTSKAMLKFDNYNLTRLGLTELKR